MNVRFDLSGVVSMNNNAVENTNRWRPFAVCNDAEGDYFGTRLMTKVSHFRRCSHNFTASTFPTINPCEKYSNQFGSRI